MSGPTASRPYKGFTPKAGVYQVTHLPSGRSLLGSSPHLDAALNRTRMELGWGRHRNPDLQHDWNQDGEAGFRFEILDVLPPGPDGTVAADDLKELLGLWQANLARSAEQTY